MKKYIHIFVVIIFLVVAFFVLTYRENIKDISPEEIKYVELGNKILNVDLALTAKEQERGLSGRKELKENAGMLFVFNLTTVHYFWMKDMNFSIDMIWLDEFGQVVYIQKNVSPDSYPTLFGPNKSSKYVLETQAGFSEKNNIEVGMKANFSSSVPILKF
ncbi:MAG: DUF192 domain-containing protein [Patescibacteria group bacterium]